MFGRPRCREWTPLVTQQLRLRSLIQIVGYNIRPPEWCSTPYSFYLTLHHTTMSAPFYTSEKICSPHPKWKEIDSEITHRISSANVVIRVWCHIPQNNKDDDTPAQDTVIQTWGVYFTGLRYIGANLASNFNSDCFKSNTLVFQMHGGYFCSYKSLKLDIIPAEYEVEHSSLSSDSSGRTNLSKIVLEPKFIQNNKLVKESRSISPNKHTGKYDKEYSKSHSPVERGFQQNFPTLRSSASLNISQSESERHREGSSETTKPNPNHIYEHSPDNLDVKEFTSNDCDNMSKNASEEDLCSRKIDLSETAESYDLRNESDGAPKFRYMALNFLKSEIRPSYNARKLQKLHLLQYSIKKRQEAVQEIKERIYKKSSLTDDSWSHPEEDNIKFKRSQKNLFSSDDEEDLNKDKLTSEMDLSMKNGRVKENKPVSNGPRLTLKLNDLLSFKAKPSPFQRAEHVRLTKQQEILRFKRIILSDERDSKLASIRRLKERHAKLFEEIQDVGTELMQSYHELSRRTEQTREARAACAARRELAARAHAALASRRHELLTQLHDIFYIEQKEPSSWSICGIPLAICGDEPPCTARAAPDAAGAAAAAGYGAQAACLAAAVLNQPMRYKITLLGSATKILDVTPDLPDPNIPLFARGGDMTLFRYAMFLLNKCIAQLMVGRGLHVTDIRPTLANLQKLLTAPMNLAESSKSIGTQRASSEAAARTQSLRSLAASERGKYRQFNRFKDAVDGHPPQSAMILRNHRHSRSVGSYHDDQELANLDASTTSIMGSESNIYNMKLIQAISVDLEQSSLKAHNSDEILQDSTESSTENLNKKVVFTLGDDTTLSSEKLVRISTNNDDEITCASCLDENVKRICSEIEHYCLTNVGEVSNMVHEGFDVASHMETIDIAKYMETKTTGDVDTCDTCDSDCDIACAKTVMDVIVIPSAEAILDTGQGDGLPDAEKQ